MGSTHHLTVLPRSGRAGPGEHPLAHPPLRSRAQSRSARSGAHVQGRSIELVDTVVMLAASTWIAMVLGLSFWTVAPQALGWKPELVLTGSMRPAISPGDVVLVVPVTAPVRPGHIVLVSDPSRSTGTYLHRVVRYDDDGLMVTKGDANPTEDVEHVPLSRVKAEARVMVPHIGLPAVWMRDGRLAQLVAVGLLTWTAGVVGVSRDAPSTMIRRLFGRA